MDATLKANREIRESMKQNHVTLWRLADALGQSETTVCKKLRHELSDNERETYLQTIAAMAAN